MAKVTPFLWFDTQAEEAAQLYTSLVRNSRITGVTRYPEGTPGMAGTVMTVTFQLDGQDFIALNGGPSRPFTEAISFAINCESQEEVDRLWGRLSEGGATSQCGWLSDRYGLSWQIVPSVLGTLLADPDLAKAQRVAGALMQMTKIDIATLQRAHAGER